MASLVSTLQEVAEYLRVRGPIGFLKAFVHRFLVHYQRLLVLELSLDRFVGPPRPASRSLRSIHVRRGTDADVDAALDLLRRNGHWRRRREFETVLGQDSSFFVATNGAGLIAYGMVSPTVPPTCRFARSLELGPGCAYGVHAFVAPRHRGQGVYPALMVEIVRDLRDRGYRRILLVCDGRNRAALSSHLRIGMKAIQELRVLRLAGLSWPRLRRLGDGVVRETGD